MRKAKSDLIKKINGATVTQALVTAIELNILDYLDNQQRCAKEIAEALSLDLPSLEVLLEQLEMIKIIKKDEAGTLQLTEEGCYLTKNHPESMRALALYKGSKLLLKPLEKLTEAIKTKKRPFTLAFEKSLFSYLEEDQVARESYHEAMEYFERESSKEILSLYDFSKLKSVVDVGGGRGSFLKSVQKRYPHIQGTVFDRKEVLSSCSKDCVNLPSSNAVFRFISGDFFDSIPTGADGYILRNILHDWDDESAILLLKNIRSAMRLDSRLLLFETIKSPKNHIGKFSDLTLLLLTEGGRGRTGEELMELLTEGGLILHKVYQTGAAKGLIEACAT